MAISNKVKNALEGASWVRKMFEEGDELKRIYGEENVCDFSLGNPNLEPPASLKKALKDLADHPIVGMHRYMSNSGYSETRRMIAEYLAEESDLPFQEKHVVMTVGAAGGLNVALKAILDEGDEVIVPAPYWVSYPPMVSLAGGSPVIAETTEKNDHCPRSRQNLCHDRLANWLYRRIRRDYFSHEQHSESKHL